MNERQAEVLQRSYELMQPPEPYTPPDVEWHVPNTAPARGLPDPKFEHIRHLPSARATAGRQNGTPLPPAETFTAHQIDALGLTISIIRKQLREEWRAEADRAMAAARLQLEELKAEVEQCRGELALLRQCQPISKRGRR